MFFEANLSSCLLRLLAFLLEVDCSRNIWYFCLANLYERNKQVTNGNYVGCKSFVDKWSFIFCKTILMVSIMALLTLNLRLNTGFHFSHNVCTNKQMLNSKCANSFFAYLLTILSGHLVVQTSWTLLANRFLRTNQKARIIKQHGRKSKHINLSW